ncbi:MAG: hypothetical protein ACTSO8_08165 [Promethearchaeota archaeon]
MKKSIVVSTSSTKFYALAFKENLKGSIKKIADLGFDGAELAVRNPKDLEIVFKNIFRLFFIVNRYYCF